MKWTIDYLRARCDEEGECWLWKHSCQGKGYPQANIDGRHQLVQRYAFTELFGRKLPKAWCVVAKCGNRRCCSEVCLVARSRGQILKKAYRDGSRSLERQAALGRASAISRGICKLDMDKAKEIRARRGAGELLKDVAKDYGVHPDTVSRIAQNKLWREHVNGASVFHWTPT